MTLTPEGGAAIPVSVTTTRKVQGGAAIPVYGYMTAPTDGRPAMGGSAIPVRVLTAADLKQNGGQWTLEGRPHAMPVYTAPAGVQVQGGPAIAVYPVNAWPTVAAAPSALLTDLVAYWHLEEAAGSRVDATGRGNDLDSNRGAPGNAAGYTNNALSLNGSQTLYRASTTDLQTGMASWSAACLALATSTAGDQLIIVKSQVSPTALREWSVGIALSGPEMFGLVLWNTVGGPQVILATEFGKIGAGIWYLVMCGYDADTNKAWISVNNVIRETATPTVTVEATAAGFGLGAYSDGLVGPFAGKIDEVAFAKRAWSASDRNLLANSGAFLPYPFTASPTVQAAPIFFVGDSLTIGYPLGIVSAYPSQWAAASKHVEWINRGVSGASIGWGIANDTTRIDPYVKPSRTKNTIVVWLGTNELYGGGTAADVYANLQTYCAARHAAGFQKVVVLTICPRQDAGVAPTFEANRLTVNTNIRNNWASFCEGIADPGGAAELADPTDLTYYQADKVHMTAAGYGIVKDLVQPVLAGL